MLSATPTALSCALGSVKSNVGHLESAAGVAGLTKVVLQLQHGTVAPSLHSAEPNPAIDFSETPFHVPQEPTQWPRPANGLRRAGLSAFGAGGSNAHLLIEEYVAEAPTDRSVGPYVFPVSARNEERLRELAGRLAAALRDDDDADTSGDLDACAARVAELIGIPADAVDPDATLDELGLRASDLARLDATRCSLDDTVRTLATHLPSGAVSGPSAHDVAATLQDGRAAMQHRLVVVADDLATVASELAAFAETGETGRAHGDVDADAVAGCPAMLRQPSARGCPARTSTGPPCVPTARLRRAAYRFPATRSTARSTGSAAGTPTTTRGNPHP